VPARRRDAGGRAVSSAAPLVEAAQVIAVVIEDHQQLEALQTLN